MHGEEGYRRWKRKGGMQGRKGHEVDERKDTGQSQLRDGRIERSPEKRRHSKEQDRCSRVKGFFCARRLTKCPMSVHIQNIWDFPGGQW